MSKEEIEKMIVSLIDDTKKIKNALSQLETDVAILKTGDANGPYWDGSNAYQCIKTSMTQIEYDVDLLKNIKKCINYLKTLI